MTILVFSVGTISIVGTSQLVMGLGGDTLKNLLGGCIYGACKDTEITGNVTDGILAGCVYAGCKNTEITGQAGPTPNIVTLIVTKLVASCPNGQTCPPSSFTIKISGVTASPSSFPGSETGTEVTVSPGTYTVSEIPSAGGFTPSFSGDCTENASGGTASGSIKAGETKKCTIKNTSSD